MPGPSSAPIARVHVSCFTVPTDGPESDGTYEWNATTLVLVRIAAGGAEGLGYTYAETATAALIHDMLAARLEGCDALAIGARWIDLTGAVRNVGRPGIASMAISAIDTALWDLKAKLLGVSLSTLLGRARAAIPAYGSGGFTSYSEQQLAEQLGGWAHAGMRFVKMKVGREPARDAARVHAAKHAVGEDVQLFVDANGAYTLPQALDRAERFADAQVRWFEEPVSSDDLAGLAHVRRRAPPGMAIAAGEYGYDPGYFRRMLQAGAVDVLQADATRCGGITGFLDAAALCEAFGVPLSSHCAPALHVPLCCAARRAVHLEYFHDHARIERLLFDGAPEPRAGLLAPDTARPGLGLVFRDKDAQCFSST